MKQVYENKPQGKNEQVRPVNSGNWRRGEQAIIECRSRRQPVSEAIVDNLTSLRIRRKLLQRDRE